MTTIDKNVHNWISGGKSTNQNTQQNFIARIVKSAFASFADLFESPKMR